MDVFLYIGAMFLICIPFVLLVRGRKNKAVSLAEGMH
jgi:DHA2 family multidrug resistance protein